MYRCEKSRTKLSWSFPGSPKAEPAQDLQLCIQPINQGALNPAQGCRDSPSLLHRALCPAPALPLIFHVPSLVAPWPPPLLFPCVLSPVSPRHRCPRTYRSQQTFLSPPHIFFYFLSVRCGKPNRMITQHVPCVSAACWEGTAEMTNGRGRNSENTKWLKKGGGANRVQPCCGFVGLDRAAKPRDKYSDVPLVCQQAIGKNPLALSLEE